MDGEEGISSPDPKVLRRFISQHLSAARWHVSGWPWHIAANIWGSALVCPYMLPLRDILGPGSALQAPQVNNVSCNLFPPGFFQIIQTTAALNGGVIPGR